MTTITGAGGLTFNLSFDPSTNSAPTGFQAAVDYAAQLLADNISSSATLTVNVGWGEVGGFSLPGNALGASSYNFVQETYSQVRSAIIGHASTDFDDTHATASLGTTDPTGGGNFVISDALGRQLGLVNGNGTDGSIGFGTGFTYTFDPNNRAVSGEYDFIGTATHELTEVMGRVADIGKTIGGITNTYSALDLFRYSGSGTRDLGAGGYASPDGGVTNLNNFSTSGDAGDWSGSNGADSFNAFANSGVVNPLTANDFRELDAMGWNVVHPFVPSGNLSPDGTILLATQSGSVQANSGTWTFGSATGSNGDHFVLLNGATPPTPGAGTEMEVANHGNLYVENSSAQWYEWLNNGWAGTSNPTPPSLSPDGTILLATQSGSLQANSGAWTFGQATGSNGDHFVLLNGATPPTPGAGTEMEVANGGNLYVENSSAQWYEWLNNGWGGVANPNGQLASDNTMTFADMTDKPPEGMGSAPATLSFDPPKDSGTTIVMTADQPSFLLPALL